jgi:hypothetical protein
MIVPGEPSGTNLWVKTSNRVKAGLPRSLVLTPVALCHQGQALDAARRRGVRIVIVPVPSNLADAGEKASMVGARGARG